MEPLNGAREALWLCLHFPLLPLEIFTRGMDPGDLQHPVVVLERQHVSFLNPAAMEAGIQPGSSMDTAYSLSSLVTCMERDEEKESAAINNLARWSYQFTPTVCLKNSSSLLLDITGCLGLFGGLHSLKKRISEGLDHLGHQCQMANSPTPLGALLLARAERVSANSTGLKNSLAEVSIVFMDADQEIIESLHSMGIHLMKDLFALPTSGLGRRFGRNFVDYLDRLTGIKADPQEPVIPAPDFFSEIHFLSDVTNTQSLIFPMKRLLLELSDFLTGRQLRVDRFAWEIKHRSHQTEKITLHMASPENNQAMFLTLTQLQLEQFSGMPEVDSLALVAKRFSPARLVTSEMFRDNSHQKQSSQKQSSQQQGSHGDREESTLLLNMFRARLGPETCFGLSLANDHRPEKAWKRVRLDRKDYWYPLGEKQMNPRPLYLLSPAKALRDNRGTPVLHGPLELLRGPERIDFGWWERDTARDYYVARHGSGSLYWIFNHLKSRRWYLHGIFS